MDPIPFEPSSWRELVEGARPEPREPEDFEPGTTRDGWQHEAGSRVEETIRAESLPNDVRLQKSPDEVQRRAGSSSGTADMPCQQLFRVVLLRCLQLEIFSVSPSRAELPVWPST